MNVYSASNSTGDGGDHDIVPFTSLSIALLLSFFLFFFFRSLCLHIIHLLHDEDDCLIYITQRQRNARCVVFATLLLP